MSVMASRIWREICKQSNIFERSFTSSTSHFYTPSHAYANAARPPFNPQAGFKITESPNPSWELGQGLSESHEDGLGHSWKEDEKKGWRTWVLKETPPREVYPLLVSAVVPRPIAFISSLSADGIPNLAPFSYFSLISHNPPLLSVSFALSPRRPKDTRENILATREFTVNIISEPFVEAANSTSVEAPADVDEWLVSGLSKEPSKDVKPARVKESAISFECELYHYKDISPPNSSEVTTTLVLGLIHRMHVRNAVLREDGTVDPNKLRAVSRLGGTTYGRIGEGFELPRVSWKLVADHMGELGRRQAARRKK